MTIKLKYLFLFLLICFLMCFPFLEDTHGIEKEGLDISLSTDKILYVPGEKIKVKAYINASRSYSKQKLISKLFRYTGIQPPILLKQWSFSEGQSFPVSLDYDLKSINVEYGHLLRIVVYSSKDQKVLGSKDTVLEVTNDPAKILRITTSLVVAPPGHLREDFSKDKIQAAINKLRDFHITGVVFFEILPPSILAPTEKIWSHPRRKEPIAEASYRNWKELLAKSGLLSIGYDQIAAQDNRGQRSDWIVYTPLTPANEYNSRGYSLLEYFPTLAKKKQPLRLYGLSFPYDGNLLRMKNYYSLQLADSLKKFSWNGFFFDSITWLFEATAFGLDEKGYPVTNLGPDEVGEDFMKEIDKYIYQNKPFIKIANGGFGGMVPGWQKGRNSIMESNAAKSYPKTKNKFNIWAVEFPALNVLKKYQHLYPITLGQFGVALHGLKELNKIPVMVVPQVFFPRTVDGVKRLYGLSMANGINIYYTEILQKTNAADTVPETIKIYNRFSTRYSAYLYDPKVQWAKNITVNCEKNCKGTVYFSDTIFEKPTKNGKQVFIHLLNLNPDQIIWENEKINPIKDLKITVHSEPLKTPKRMFLMSPDRENQDHVVLPFIMNKDKITFNIDLLDFWNLIVIEF